MTKKNAHGGKRQGAGRKYQHGEPTILFSVRLPVSMVKAIDQMGTRTETIIKALKTHLLGNQ